VKTHKAKILADNNLSGLISGYSALNLSDVTSASTIAVLSNAAEATTISSNLTAIAGWQLSTIGYDVKCHSKAEHNDYETIRRY